MVPRDVGAREIYNICVNQGLGVHGDMKVYLDLTHHSREFLDRRLGGILEIYEKFTGVDPREEPMEIFPAVHYSMGGIWTDYNRTADGFIDHQSPRNQMTSMEGLYAAGEADYAVANTYYIALMLSGKKGPEQQAAAKKVKPFFPNQTGRGTHMNISGAGILKHAPNKSNAIKLLEFLVTPEAQEHIVNNTFEYPIIEGVEPSPLIGQFGLNFKQDLKTKVSSYYKNQAEALKIMTEAGWN